MKLKALLLALGMAGLVQQATAGNVSPMQGAWDEANRSLSGNQQAAVLKPAVSTPDAVPPDAKTSQVSTPSDADKPAGATDKYAAPKNNPKASGADVTQPGPVSVIPGTGTSVRAPQGVTNPGMGDAASTAALRLPSGRAGSMPILPAGAQSGVFSQQQRQPTPSTGFPGLGQPDAYHSAKPVTVQAQSGINEIVSVSNHLPNRIATPFTDPKIVDFSGWQIKKLNGSIFVIPTTPEPAGIFITEDAPGAPTIALTLVPKPIPGQTILVNIDSGYRSGKSKETEAEATPNSYEDQMRSIMRKLALGKPVAGYTETNLGSKVAMVGQLVIAPEKQLSGQSLDLFVYNITNAGKDAVELTEESFYQKGVKAVVIFPNVRLAPKQETKVFIASGKLGDDKGDE